LSNLLKIRKYGKDIGEKSGKLSTKSDLHRVGIDTASTPESGLILVF